MTLEIPGAHLSGEGKRNKDNGDYVNLRFFNSMVGGFWGASNGKSFTPHHPLAIAPQPPILLLSDEIKNDSKLDYKQQLLLNNYAENIPHFRKYFLQIYTTFLSKFKRMQRS